VSGARQTLAMDLRRLATWIERPGRHRGLIATGLFVLLLAFGALDSVTGSDLSLGVFYVLLVVAITVVAGAVAGIGAAALSALLWGAADVITSPSGLSVWIDLWNVVTRFAVHAIVVLLVASLLHALRLARESEARSRAFLATAAHQLRTPIAALRASAEALVVEGATPAQERLLANLAGEASRLGRLAAALLRTARLDQGEPVRPRPVDVRQVVLAEVERARQLSVAECRLAVDPRIPAVVVVDPDATAEAVSNLLDNARRYARAVIDVRLSAERGWLVIEVTDDGPGLPAGSETEAFQRFVTLDGRGGTGLGLAIARELTQRQGGDLGYAGKAFVLRLPLSEASGRRPDHGSPDAGRPADRIGAGA